MAFHKRRILPSPNKNAAKVLRRQENSAPRLDALYPSVERLLITLRFLDAKGNFLDERLLSLRGSDPANFRVDCVGPCGDGRMDLEGKLRDVIQKREPVSEARGKCSRPLSADLTDVCGYELHCRIEASYR